MQLWLKTLADIINVETIKADNTGNENIMVDNNASVNNTNADNGVENTVNSRYLDFGYLE